MNYICCLIEGRPKRGSLQLIGKLYNVESDAKKQGRSAEKLQEMRKRYPTRPYAPSRNGCTTPHPMGLKTAGKVRR